MAHDPPDQRPTWAEVDLSAVRHNVRLLRGHSRAEEFMAVVKADGYGHGAVPVARAALEAGATWLGVALVEEGVQLRGAGIDAPILVLSEPPAAAARELLAHRLTPTVYTHGFTQALLAAADGPVRVHLKLDTGMRRVGLAQEHWADAMAHLAANERIRVTGIWSHLAVGDEPGNPFTDSQGRRFARGLEMAEAAGLRPTIRHLCNSGGTTLSPELHLDMVRVGIAMYGMAASPGVKLEGLRPVMAVRSRLSLIKPVRRGETVSYGRIWAADRDTVVGTVPVGYADGIRRGLNRRVDVEAVMTHRGRRVPYVGTICMDQLLVDLGPGAAADAGDDVWLIGGPGPDPVTAEDWAAWLDTITYEVTCGIGARIPRVHMG